MSENPVTESSLSVERVARVLGQQRDAAIDMRHGEGYADWARERALGALMTQDEIATALDIDIDAAVIEYRRSRNA